MRSVCVLLPLVFASVVGAAKLRVQELKMKLTARKKSVVETRTAAGKKGCDGLWDSWADGYGVDTCCGCKDGPNDCDDGESDEVCQYDPMDPDDGFDGDARCAYGGCCVKSCQRNHVYDQTPGFVGLRRSGASRIEDDCDGSNYADVDSPISSCRYDGTNSGDQPGLTCTGDYDSPKCALNVPLCGCIANSGKAKNCKDTDRTGYPWCRVHPTCPNFLKGASPWKRCAYTSSTVALIN